MFILVTFVHLGKVSNHPFNHFAIIKYFKGQRPFAQVKLKAVPVL